VQEELETTIRSHFDAGELERAATVALEGRVLGATKLIAGLRCMCPCPRAEATPLDRYTWATHLISMTSSGITSAATCTQVWLTSGVAAP
jgi:hypothetical protein